MAGTGNGTTNETKVEGACQRGTRQINLSTNVASAGEHCCVFVCGWVDGYFYGHIRHQRPTKDPVDGAGVMMTVAH